MTLPPSTLAMVSKLSKLQRDFLIDHVDGPRPVSSAPVDSATRRALLFRELIRLDPARRGRLGGADDCTVLTDLGREALGVVLGECADQLVRAGYRVEKPHPVLPFGPPLPSGRERERTPS